MPPKFSYTDERLELITKNLRPGLRNVIEFRNKSWWNDNVYKQLKKAQIIFCGMSYPSLPDEPIINGTVAYYRFHGVPKLYYSYYEAEMMARIADGLMKKKIKAAYVYFNNTASMAGIENAVWFRQYVRFKNGK